MHRNEYVMTRLRTAKGIDSVHFISTFGEPAWFGLLAMAEKHIRKEHLVVDQGRLFFNPAAWFHSDGILSDLFLVK